MRARAVAVWGGLGVSVAAVIVAAVWGWQRHALERTSAEALLARLPAIEQHALRARGAPATELAPLLPLLDGLAASAMRIVMFPIDCRAPIYAEQQCNLLKQCLRHRCLCPWAEFLDPWHLSH